MSMMQSAIDFLSPSRQLDAPGRGVEEGKTVDENVANTKCETEELRLAAPQSLTFEGPEDPSKFRKEQSVIAEDCITIIAHKARESQDACDDVTS